MSDVQFTIGGTAAPFQQALQQASTSAKESAGKITEAFGIEGVKSERALHTRFLGAFNDITKGGTSSAEAIGGAFENMTEGLKLSMGSMIALLAVTELVKTLNSGYEAAEKMEAGVKDALSINTDVTHQSVEKVQESIKKLQADADANNLASMSAMQAGATVFVQALEEGKSIADVTREDAENYNRLKQEAHDMEDESGAKAIQNENDVLELKLQGYEAEAEALQHQQQMQDKLDEAQEKHNAVQEAALQRQIELEGQLAEKTQQDKTDELIKQADAGQKQADGVGATPEQKLASAQAQYSKDFDAWNNFKADTNDISGSEQKQLQLQVQMLKSFTAQKEAQLAVDQKAKDVGKEITAEQQRRSEMGKSDKQKLEDATAQRKKDADAYAAAQADSSTSAQSLLSLQLQMEKSITAEKEAQTKADQQAKEVAKQKATLLQEQKEAQQAVQAAAVDSTLFHGQVSSLAKVGLGGRVSGANYGNQAQLKASQEAVKHLADVNKKLDALAKGIGSV